MNPSTLLPIISQQTTSSEFSGVIHIQQAGEIIHSQGYGFAYRPEKIPNRSDTRFGTASGTKTLTAVATLRLVEQGKFTLDTPITECITAEIPPYDPGVTVHHLLTHTSGIPDYFDEEILTDADYEQLYIDHPPHTLKRPADYLPMFPDAPMNFTPGERFRYCNGGYILLALLIEEYVEGSYQEHIEETVFKRAGMSGSGFFWMDSLPENTAYGYVNDEKRKAWRTNSFEVPIVGGGDGGAFVTAPDIDRFWSALHDHTLLSEKMTERLLTSHVTTNEETRRGYGYGLWIDHNEDGSVFRTSAIGSDQGVNFISSHFPEHALTVTVIGNTEGPTWTIIRALVEEIEQG